MDVPFVRSVPDIVFQSAPCFSATAEVHRPDDRGGRIDGHRSGDIGEGIFVEEHFHVCERADGHAGNLADDSFSFGEV